MSNHSECMLLAKKRLQWARHRIYQFSAEVDIFLQEGKSSIVCETEDAGNGKLCTAFRFRCSGQLPDHLGFGAGDAIHNLRSVIDGIVRGVALANGADPRLALVFTNNPAHFASLTKRKNLHKLPAPIIEWYEGEQTHNRRDNSPSLLCMTNTLWNEDKHRSPVLVYSGVPEVVCGGPTAPIVGEVDRVVVAGGGVLEDGAVVLRAYYSPDKVVQFHPRLTVDVSFNNGCDRSARRFLSDVADHIDQKVFPLFEPFLA